MVHITHNSKKKRVIYDTHLLTHVINIMQVHCNSSCKCFARVFMAFSDTAATTYTQTLACILHTQSFICICKHEHTSSFCKHMHEHACIHRHMYEHVSVGIHKHPQAHTVQIPACIYKQLPDTRKHPYSHTKIRKCLHAL